GGWNLFGAMTDAMTGTMKLLDYPATSTSRAQITSASRRSVTSLCGHRSRQRADCDAVVNQCGSARREERASTAIQNPAYALRQGGTGERFLQHRHARVKATLVNDRIARVSRDVERPEIRPLRLQRFCKLSSIDARQHDVGQ